MAPEWEDTRCPLCRNRDEEILITQPAEKGSGVDQYTVVSCRACSFAYLNPRPTERSLGFFYPENYEPYQAQKIKPVKPWHRWFGGSDSQTNLPVNTPGRLLDFGCGGGNYLLRMKARGWAVEGIDFSAHAVESARKSGLTVHHGNLPHPAVRPASFDVVNLGAVLEHVHDPHRLIQAAKQTIRPGGLMVISVPNIESWGFQHFQTAWWPLELPRHLLHFSKTTLLRLAAENGLEVIEIRFPSRTSWMKKTRERAKTNQQLQLSSTGERSLKLMNHLSPSMGWFSRWSSWRQKGDCLLLIARRPYASVLSKAA